MSTATSLWLRLRQDLDRRVETLFQRRRVLGIEDDGRVRLGSIEPGVQMELVAPALRGAVIKPGDDALTLRFAGRELVVDAIRKPGDTDDEGIVSGDGDSPLAARVDHNHLPASGNSEGMEIGQNAASTKRGVAIGSASEAADAGTVLGVAAKALGYVAVALGFGASAAGERAIAIGNSASAAGAFAVALGYAANASGSQATALGDRTEALGARSVAIGYAADATMMNTVGIGYAAKATADHAIAIGYATDASGLRSFGLGYNADIAEADAGLIGANRVYIRRSSGTGNTALYMQKPDGAYQGMAMEADETFWIGNRRYGTLTGFFPANKSIASGGPWSLRSAPVVSSANFIVGLYSASVHDTTWRVTAGGYTWASVFVHGYGWGWIVQEALV